MTRRPVWLLVLALFASEMFAHPAMAAEPDGKDEAKARFERGVMLYRDKKLDPALAEFVASLRLFPTRAAGFNAVHVYKELGRYDEALEVLDLLATKFPTLEAADRAELEREQKDLEVFVGTIAVEPSEAEVSIAIDGQARPTAKSYRISVGTHVVRVFKEGFVPFEARVEVASKATVRVAAKLGALTRGGRLTVTEDRGTQLAVLIDGIEVGKTPYEGTVAVGKHAVALRGDKRLGSPPTPVEIRLNQLTKLSLVAEPLVCALRVEPTPRSAHVAIDGVEVGDGVWEGPLRCGGHQVEIGAEGFVAKKRAATLAEGPALLVRETLDRDPTSPLWQAKHPPKIFFDAEVTPLVTPGFGGPLSSFGFGGAMNIRGGYRLGLGLGASIDAGFLGATTKQSGRSTETLPYGLPAHPGTADDRLTLTGPMLGGSLSYAIATKLPILVRLGAGVIIGTLQDRRSGAFTTPSGANYTLPEIEQSPSLTSLYVDPEARIGFPIFRGGTIDVGVRGVLVAPLGGSPRFSNASELSLGACPNADRNVCAGRGVYASQELTSGLFFFVGPTVALRIEL